MPIIKLEVKYEIGDVAYLRTDPEGFPYIILGYIMNPNSLLYRMSNQGEVINAYLEEMSPIPATSPY